MSISESETNVSIRAKLERLISESPAEPKSEMPPSETAETLRNQAVEPLATDDISVSETRNETGNVPQIEGDRPRRVTEMKRNGLSQTAIIQIEWNAKPGSNKAYQDALAEYKEIVGE